MRLVLVLVLVHALVPDLAEVGEAIVHYVQTGHVAHTADDHGDLGDQGPEHGCGTTQHRCTCCAADPMAAPPRAIVAASLARAETRSSAPPAVQLAAREPSRPFRPPIS